MDSVPKNQDGNTEDDFLHKLASKLCDSGNTRQATVSYVHALEILCDHVSKDFKDNLLPFSQTTDINMKL